MVEKYQGSLGTTVNVIPSGSSVSVGFNSRLVLIGDGTSGSASLGEAVRLTRRSDAEEQFGKSSNLYKAYVAAEVNGAQDVYGVSVDDSVTDPDYIGAAKEAMDADPRYIMVASTVESNVQDVLSEVNTRANNLEFARVFAPISDVTSPSDVGTYTTITEDQRLVEVAPQEGTFSGETIFTAAAVAGHATTKALGDSMAYDSILADSLGTKYRDSDATNFDGVAAVTKDEQIVDGVTTSSDAAFQDIFQMEIVDTVALGLDQIAQDYAGDAPNTPEQRANLRGDMRIFLESLADQSPPLLADAFGNEPYTISTSVGASEEDVDVSVGINPVDVMKQITIDLSVGRIVEYGGTN